MHCFKTQIGTGKVKRIIDQLVEKEEKKLLAEHLFVLKDFNLVGFFTVERFFCSEKKLKRQRFKRIFRYNLHINGQGSSVSKWPLSSTF